LSKFNSDTNNGQDLKCGILYFVKENNSSHFRTNNIDGSDTIYNALTPTGDIEITENGDEIDISQYATATVDVPIPEGYIIPTGDIEITENGEEINVREYETATVNVGGGARVLEGVELSSVTGATGEFDGKKYFETVTIPNGHTSIGSTAFSNCTSLTSVTIPDSVTSIGDGAFSNCTSLTSVTIPDSVTSIGNNALYGCSSLASITIPDSVTSIGNNAFSNCRSLNKLTINDLSSWCGVTLYSQNSHPLNAFGDLYLNDVKITDLAIPNTVTEIKNYTFKNCSFASITIPDSVTSIGNNAFSNCRSLTSVAIGNGVTSIGNGAFQHCRRDITVNVPDSVTTIGSDAFADAFTTVIVGTGITSIGGNAFQVINSTGAIRIASVTVKATTPPTITSNTFNVTSSALPRYPIYVPAESVEAYKTATNWSNYASRIQPIPSE